MRSELVPRMRAGRACVSVSVTKFASGETFPASGLYSTPAVRRGWNLYVRVLRHFARAMTFETTRTPYVHLSESACPAPLTARPSPGQSGQEGTLAAAPGRSFA